MSEITYTSQEIDLHKSDSASEYIMHKQEAEMSCPSLLVCTCRVLIAVTVDAIANRTRTTWPCNTRTRVSNRIARLNDPRLYDRERTSHFFGSNDAIVKQS